MTDELAGRLDQILPLITDSAFLSSEGIGNEIACYIFDYPAREELVVRKRIALIRGRLASHHADLEVLHLDLLDVVVRYLRKRRLLDKAISHQAAKGDAGVLAALKGPLAAQKISAFIAAEHQPADADLVLISGVGSVWPMLRAHSLLNCLHSVMGRTPLVLFYPGSFDGTSLRLFGRIAGVQSKPGTKNYYRAFILVPGRTQP